MFFIRKKKNFGFIAPLPNILLCRAIKEKQTEEMFNKESVWLRISLFATLNLTIRKFPSYFDNLPKVSFQFSEKRDPQPGHITIFCEHGWTPRDHYQISSTGVNQHHHVAKLLSQNDTPVISGLSKESYDFRLRALQESFFNLHPPTDLCAKPFFLFALQVTSDLNLKRSGLDLAALADKKDGSQIIRQRLSERIAEANPSARVLFLQHPVGSPDEPDVPLCDNHSFVRNTHKLRALDLACSPNCLGVITINSNTLNEALIFSLPVFQLGDFLTTKFPSQFFPYSLAEFMADPDYCRAISKPESYLSALLENQWSLQDLKNPRALRTLFDQELARL